MNEKKSKKKEPFFSRKINLKRMLALGGLAVALTVPSLKGYTSWQHYDNMAKFSGGDYVPLNAHSVSEKLLSDFDNMPSYVRDVLFDEERFDELPPYLKARYEFTQRQIYSQFIHEFPKYRGKLIPNNLIRSYLYDQVRTYPSSEETEETERFYKFADVNEFIRRSFDGVPNVGLGVNIVVVDPLYFSVSSNNASIHLDNPGANALYDSSIGFIILPNKLYPDNPLMTRSYSVVLKEKSDFNINSFYSHSEYGHLLWDFHLSKNSKKLWEELVSKNDSLSEFKYEDEGYVNSPEERFTEALVAYTHGFFCDMFGNYLNAEQIEFLMKEFPGNIKRFEYLLFLNLKRNVEMSEEYPLVSTDLKERDSLLTKELFDLEEITQDSLDERIRELEEETDDPFYVGPIPQLIIRDIERNYSLSKSLAWKDFSSFFNPFD